MKIEYLKSFSKDLDTLKNNSIKFRLLKLISLIETKNSFNNISQNKKIERT
jgi:mRNA-degrading endonuclease YafQ of YafQ-DinJ toxin-antitoxin module